MTREHSTTSISLPESGTLPVERTADLLVDALASSFDGSLFVATDQGERIAFRIRGGLVARWHSLEGHAIVLEALSELLPPEQIELVLKHSEAHHTDELGAIRRLCLLADTALYRLHRDCLSRELRAIMTTSRTLEYRFAPGRDCFEVSEGLDQVIEPLGVIAEALLHAPNLDFCRERIQATRHLPLFLRGSAGGANADLRGGARQIIQSLKRLPESFETLRLRNLVPEKTLIATVYALWVTDSVEQAGHRRSLAPEANKSVFPNEATQHFDAGPPRSATATGSTVRSSEPLVKRGDEPRSAPPQRFDSRPTNQSGRYRIRSDTLSATSRSTPPPGSLTEMAGGPASHGPASGGHARHTSESFEPTHTHTHATPAQELAAENKALDAWLRAVDDPSIAGRALKLAEKAADYFPTNSNILFYLGCLLTMADQTLEGEAVIRHVLELDPDHLEAQNELERVKKINRSQSRTRSTARLTRWGIRRSL